MGNSVQELLSIGTDSLSSAKPNLHPLADRFPESVLSPLSDLLTCTNGFYAFESSLHVLCCEEGSSDPLELLNWNNRCTWISDFEGAADGYIFFAEDAFGYPFGVNERGVFTFDPETAESTFLAATLQDWANVILQRYEELTGFPAAHDWQAINGPLEHGRRLLPIDPIIAGGTFEPKNLKAVSTLEAIRFRANFYKQTRDLPDGASFTWKIVD